MVQLDIRQRWRRAVAAMARTFGRDEQGGTAVQAIVFLPVIIMSLVVLGYLWQVITIRRSLHTGTYLAARYLSLYPPETADPYVWSGVAQKFVWAELRNNPFVDPVRVNEVYANVWVTLTNGNECLSEFTVETEYQFFAPLNKTNSRFLPGMKPVGLEEARVGKVLCKP